MTILVVDHDLETVNARLLLDRYRQIDTPFNPISSLL